MSVQKSMRRIRFLPYLPVWLLPLILFARPLFLGEALFWGTPLLQFAPWWRYAAETLRAGELPLWNPLVGMGAPLLANYQTGLFYPSNWLYLLLDTAGGLPALTWGMALGAALHLGWAGTGMARLARRLGLGTLAQTVSGLAFGLCGYLVARAWFFSVLSAASWLPWILLALTRWFGPRSSESIRPDWKAPLLLAALFSLQLLAGHAQTTWYTGLLAAMWTAFLAWQGDGTLRARLARLGRAWLGLGAVVLFAVLLAAAQLLPTAEYLLQSQRAVAVDYDLAMSYSFWPWRLISLLAPDFFGNPDHGDYWGYANYWEDAIYIGLLPLLLALGALAAWLRGRRQATASLSGTDEMAYLRRRLPPFLMALLGLTFLLALGRNTPVFPWLYRHVPTFDMFQAPSRYLIWAEFALALLAGLGVSAWSRPYGSRRQWVIRGLIAALGLMLAAGAAGLLLQGVQATFIPATALLGLWGVLAALLTLLVPRLGAESESLAARRWRLAVVGVLCADLLIAGWGLNPSTSRDLYRGAAPGAESLRAALQDHRLYLPAEDEQELKFERFLRFDTFHPGEDWNLLRAAMLPNAAMLDHLPSANNFDPLLPGRYASWIEALEAASGPVQEAMLNLMDVGVVETVSTSGEFGVRFSPREGQNPRRLRFVFCARPADDPGEALDLVAGGGVDFEREVILEGYTPAGEAGCGVEPPGDVELSWERQEPNRLHIRVRTPAAGWLVISDTWYPGWQAAVDSGSAGLYPANALFRAVPVPAGDHLVSLSYRPLSFRLGLALSLGAWLVFAGLWVFARVQPLKDGAPHAARIPPTDR